MQNKIRIGAIIFVLIWLGFYIVAGHDDLPTEDRKTILTEDNILNLGNHIIAYRTSSAETLSAGEMNSSTEGNYVVVYDLDREGDNAFLLPDIYGQIYDMKMEGTDSLYISYGDSYKVNMYSVHIPMIFPTQEDYVINGSDYGKILVEAREDIAENISKLPVSVWEEAVTWDGKDYSIMFERTSLAYTMEPAQKGRLYADYYLTVKDGSGDIIFRQTIIGYPMAYEKVYWLTDFSGDGFPDIAFCTYNYLEKFDRTEIDFMIWNTENEVYEPKPLPRTRISMPRWNNARSSIICNNEEAAGTADMFSFYNGDWVLTGQLRFAYEEDEKGDHVQRYYKEVFYIDGEIAEENVIIPATDCVDIWHDILSDEENCWSFNNAENMALYPNMQGWETINVTVGEKSIEKYEKKKD